MLVLTRKRDESIMIGDDVKITVVDVRGDQVKLGIEAPRHIPVHREEIYQEIQQENRRAVLKDAPDLTALERVLRDPPAGSSPRQPEAPRTPPQASGLRPVVEPRQPKPHKEDV